MTNATNMTHTYSCNLGAIVVGCRVLPAPVEICDGRRLVSIAIPAEESIPGAVDGEMITVIDEQDLKAIPAEFARLSPASRILFEKLWHDRVNWGGTPLFGGNVGREKADQGNFTDLKAKGLLVSDNRNDDGGCCWVYFTDLGEEVGAAVDAVGWKVSLTG